MSTLVVVAAVLVALATGQSCDNLVRWSSFPSCTAASEWKQYPGQSDCRVGNYDINILLVRGPAVFSVVPQLTGLTRFRLTASAVGSAAANASCPYRDRAGSNASVEIAADHRLYERATSIVLPENRSYYVGVVGWQFGVTDTIITGQVVTAAQALEDYKTSTFVPRILTPRPPLSPYAVQWGFVTIVGAADTRLQFAFRSCDVGEATSEGHCPGMCDDSCSYENVCTLAPPDPPKCNGIAAATSDACRLTRTFL